MAQSKAKNAYEIYLTMYKLMNNKLPDWLFRFYTVGEVMTSRTRQENDLYIERHRTDLGARAFTVQGAAMWNKLPVQIKSISSFNVFKDMTKEHLIQQQRDL